MTPELQLAIAEAGIVLYIVVFLFGIVIGSFLNVCIYRIPKKENIASFTALQRQHFLCCR